MKKILTSIIVCLFLLVGTSAVAAEKSLTFTWDQTLSDDLSYFTLYEYDSVGTETGDTFNIPYVVDMSMEHAENITVPDGVSTTLCYDLTASDTSANESGKSNRVCVDIDFEAPAEPASLSITIQIVPQ